MGAYIFFGIFAIAGIAAFVGMSYSPVLFWLQNGYWEESPKQILFGIIFLISHGGVGLGGLLYLKLNPKGLNDIKNTDKDQPWLSKTYWSSPTIYSKTGSFITALKYIVPYLSIISAIVVFVLFETIKRKEYVTLFALIIPVATFFLYRYSKKLSTQKQLYGRMPLTLNPYPGSIGGQIGGTIPITLTAQSIKESTIELRCTRHTKSGDDSRQEILWNETMIPATKTTIDGQELAFCFDLDKDMSEAQASEKTPYNQWELSTQITLTDDTIIKREYSDLPVFATEQKSSIREEQAYASHSQDVSWLQP